MKKTVYTIAFIALFSVISHAQTSNQTKKAEPAKAETVNPDGTLKQATTAGDNASQDNAASQKASEKPAGGTRMAITEKGVPASKSTSETKKAEAPKSEKH